MDQFCGSELWDLNITWYTNNPDFTPCFHKTVLIWVPCAFLFLVSPYEIHKIRTAAVIEQRVPWTLLSLMKILVAFSLAVLSSIDLVNALVNWSERYLVDIYTPSIELVTYSYVSIITTLHSKNSNRASGTLFLFWMLLSIFSLTTYWSVLSELIDVKSPPEWPLDPVYYTIKITAVPLIYAAWLLACFTDSLPLFDSAEKEVHNRSPECTASFLSQITFAWFDGLVRKGYKNPLTMDDVYDLAQENKSEEISERFREQWSYPANAKISRPLLKTFYLPLLCNGLIQLLAAALRFVSPTVLDQFLIWLAGSGPQWHGILFAVVMFSAGILASTLNNHAQYATACVAMQMKTAIVSTLHRKALRLSPSTKSNSSTGQIVNLISVDTQRIVEFISSSNKYWAAPLQVVLAIYLLWQQLGVATVAGIAVSLAYIPANGYIATKFGRSLYHMMKAKDKRSKLLKEIFTGMKGLKMYSWENCFANQVKDIRKGEVNQLREQVVYYTVALFLMACSPIFVALSSFVTFTLIDENNVLDASKAFVSLALFNILQTPLTTIPSLFTDIATYRVARDRIDAFLLCDEMDPDEVGRNENAEIAIKVENGAFTWQTQDADSTLCDVNLAIKKNKLVAVVGTVGSGKSSLLASLLGDMRRTSGDVNLSGRVAYVPQQAWIQNATVRDNILFTTAMERPRYDAVLESCALEPDLEMLAAGDQTEIGEKGINLSGGQKQRVSLARAVYANCDIYLLDDPLSAVDSHVGKHLFDKVIGPQGLLKDTTRVLVTHKVSLLPQVDEIVVMKDGRISEHGSYMELVQSKGPFSEFLTEYAGEEQDETTLNESAELVPPETMNKAVPRGHRIGEIAGPASKAKQSPTTGRLVEDEMAQIGSLKFGDLGDYVKAIGSSSSIAILLASVVSSSFNVASSLWLKEWSADASDAEKATNPSLRNVRLSIYGALGVCQAVSIFMANLFIFLGTLKATAVIHNNMLEHILKAPMSFYDTTPLGRILNRFGKDIDNCDFTLRLNIQSSTINFFHTLVTIGMVCYQSPVLLLQLYPLYKAQRYYSMTSRQLRRLESNSRSPVYSHFCETVSGSTCIRAYQVENKFNEECDRKNDVNNASFILSLCAVCWLGLRLELLGNLNVLLAALFAVFSRGTVSPSTAGLFISYALTAASTINTLVKSSTDLENNFVSVERCLEYTKTPTEAPLEIESTKPEATWPEHGLVEFENYSTRYRDGLDLILKNINLKVHAGEKVGIVGRTGAGKSSLTLALFRLIEPANGSIIIDGVDVGHIGLSSLRSALTIIPQDSVLFAGTLRLNLDPLGKHDDSELWKALKLAHLQQFVDSAGQGLEYGIAEGGENLSVGQRQLFCLARALLRKSKILILDEATAAVDLETDDLIQKTIKTEFVKSTVLTIAHRLNTIMDYDRVLVLDQGMVSEFDTPKRLLDNQRSVFHSMVKDAGLSFANSS
ncbi:ATP-binding cassette sub-family C member 3 [Halotydeus destructor]|nr:ATP-binding cassette sub-family C member 3 [Halotydeus destructor]